MSGLSSVVKKLTVSDKGLNILKKRTSGYDVLHKDKHYGIGRTIARRTWQKHHVEQNDPDCYWMVTRIRVMKKGYAVNRAKAWGILTWKGLLYHNGEEREIHGLQKNGWKFVGSPSIVAAQLWPELAHPKLLPSEGQDVVKSTKFDESTV